MYRDPCWLGLLDYTSQSDFSSGWSRERVKNRLAVRGRRVWEREWSEGREFNGKNGMIEKEIQDHRKRAWRAERGLGRESEVD